MLRATHYEPVIHHAIVAIGYLHEKFKLNCGSSVDGPLKDGFALRHYNFAIRSLVQPLADAKKEEGRPLPAMDLCLTACILFANFEVSRFLAVSGRSELMSDWVKSMQASYGPAFAHIQSGIKILGEIQYDESTDMHRHATLRCASIPLVPMSVLLDIFLRADYQITDVRATLCPLPHTCTLIARTAHLHTY